MLHNLGSRPTDEGYNEVLRLLEMYYCVGKYGKISNMKHCTQQSFNGTRCTMNGGQELYSAIQTSEDDE